MPEQVVRDEQHHPLCKCGERALSRFGGDDGGMESGFGLFLCLECTIRAVRVAAAKHQLLDIGVHQVVEVGELPASPSPDLGSTMP